MSVAKAVLTGELSESEGRWEIAAIVLTENFPGAASRSVVVGNRQLQADAEDHLRSLLIDKIAGPRPALDLQRIAAGASVSGWSRQLLRSRFARIRVSEVAWMNGGRTVPVNPLDQRITEMACVDSEWSGPDGEDRSESFLSAASTYLDMASNRRQNERIHLSARTLCATYGLATPRRCVYLENRSALLERLTGSECSAQDDVIDTLEDMDHGYRGLAVAFSGCSVAELTAIADAPAIVSQRIVLAALTPSTPPVRPHCSALKQAILTAYPEVGGNHAVGSLVQEWVAVTTEAKNSEYRAGEVPVPKPKTQRNKEEMAWSRTVTNLVQRGVRSLGETPTQVAQTLAALMDSIVEQSAAAA
jgi:hypothetical protein